MTIDDAADRAGEAAASVCRIGVARAPDAAATPSPPDGESVPRRPRRRSRHHAAADHGRGELVCGVFAAPVVARCRHPDVLAHVRCSRASAAACSERILQDARRRAAAPARSRWPIAIACAGKSRIGERPRKSPRRLAALVDRGVDRLVLDAPDEAVIDRPARPATARRARRRRSETATAMTVLIMLKSCCEAGELLARAGARRGDAEIDHDVRVDADQQLLQDRVAIAAWRPRRPAASDWPCSSPAKYCSRVTR